MPFTTEIFSKKTTSNAYIKRTTLWGKEQRIESVGDDEANGKGKRDKSQIYF